MKKMQLIRLSNLDIQQCSTFRSREWILYEQAAEEMVVKCSNLDIGELVFNKFKIKTNIKGFMKYVDNNSRRKRYGKNI